MKNTTMLAGLLVVGVCYMPCLANATVTTLSSTPFNGYDLPGSSEARTEKIKIAYLDGYFNLSGVLDPFLTSLNGANTGLFAGASLVKESQTLFTWAPESIFNPSRFTFAADNLAPGAYTLKFNLMGGGFYTGSYSVTAVSAVPEVPAYALMLSGLGILGLGFRRR